MTIPGAPSTGPGSRLGPRCWVGWRRLLRQDRSLTQSEEQKPKRLHRHESEMCRKSHPARISDRWRNSPVGLLDNPNPPKTERQKAAQRLGYGLVCVFAIPAVSDRKKATSLRA